MLPESLTEESRMAIETFFSTMDVGRWFCRGCPRDRWVPAEVNDWDGGHPAEDDCPVWRDPSDPACCRHVKYLALKDRLEAFFEEIEAEWGVQDE